MNEKNRLIWMAILGLVTSVLACNFPGQGTPTPLVPPPAMTPLVPATSLPQETASPSPAELPQETTPPSPAETLPPTPTQWFPPTNTPTSPAVTPAPTVTPTQSSPGEPLEISNPGFEITDWQALPDTGEWEGHLRIIFTGGMEPYTFALESNPPQSKNSLYIRWRKCHNAPLTVHVWSGDGQEAHKGIWVESPWCPD